MGWRDEPATIKQVNFAKSLAKKADSYYSIDWDKDYTKGEMTDIIDSLKDELGMVSGPRDQRPLPGEPLPPIDPMPSGQPVAAGSQQFVGVFTVTFAASDQNQGTAQLINLLRAHGYQVHGHEVTKL